MILKVLESKMGNQKIPQKALDKLVSLSDEQFGLIFNFYRVNFRCVISCKSGKKFLSTIFERKLFLARPQVTTAGGGCATFRVRPGMTTINREDSGG